MPGRASSRSSPSSRSARWPAPTALPAGVMDDALAGMREAGWTGPNRGRRRPPEDAEDVDVTAAAGFTFFTIDPSGHVDAQADDYDEADLCGRSSPRSPARSTGSTPTRASRSACPPAPASILDEQACLRAAVKYGRAINAAVDLADHIDKVHQNARARVRDRAYGRRDRPADHPGRAFHHRRPVPSSAG